MYSSFFALPGRKIRFVRGKEKSLKIPIMLSKRKKKSTKKRKTKTTTK